MRKFYSFRRNSGGAGWGSPPLVRPVLQLTTLLASPPEALVGTASSSHLVVHKPCVIDTRCVQIDCVIQTFTSQR